MSAFSVSGRRNAFSKTPGEMLPTEPKKMMVCFLEQGVLCQAAEVQGTLPCQGDRDDTQCAEVVAIRVAVGRQVGPVGEELGFEPSTSWESSC